MATLPIARPLRLPGAPALGAALIPAVYLGGKALPSLLLRKRVTTFVRVALNPPKTTYGRLTLRAPKPYRAKQVCAALSYHLPYDTVAASVEDSTRTIAAIFALAVAITNNLIRAISSAPLNPSVVVPVVPVVLRSLKEFLASSAGKVLSSLINEYYFSRQVTTPLSPVLLVMTKFLHMYYGIVALRSALMVFDVPWEKQPFSAIRDLADPYICWVRKVTLPVKIFNCYFDVTPFYASGFLDILSMIIRPHCYDDHFIPV